jgi:hypothetical protein
MKSIIIACAFLGVVAVGCSENAEETRPPRSNSKIASAEKPPPQNSKIVTVAEPAPASEVGVEKTKPVQGDMTNDLSIYYDKAWAARKTLMDQNLSSRIVESTREMTNALAEMREHLQFAKASRQKFSNRTYATVPVQGGKLSFSFSPDGDDLRVMDITKRNSERQLLFRIHFHENGQVSSFMKGDDVVIRLFDDGGVQSYAEVLGGKPFEAEWDKSGELLSLRAQGPDGKMRLMQRQE